MSAIPYVDAVVTESHLAEGLRKTKRLDDFIEHLMIHTLRDFRHSAPGAASLGRRGRQDTAAATSRWPSSSGTYSYLLVHAVQASGRLSRYLSEIGSVRTSNWFAH